MDPSIIEFAKGLIGTIDAQDNRCTASPYFFVIQEEREVGMPNGCGDEIRYRWCDRELFGGNADELVETFEDDDGHINILNWGEMGLLDKVERVLAQFGDDIDTFEVSKQWVTPENHNVFLTEEAITKHIKANHYHWNGKTQTYVRHAWRNPEMEGVMKVLRAVAELGDSK